MLGPLKEIIVLVVTPLLLCIAWRGWSKRVHPTLSVWRNGMGVTGLIIIAVNCILAALIDIPELLHHPVFGFRWATWSIYFLAQPLDIVAIALACALKREPRLEAILAAGLMFAFWPGGYS